MSNRILTFGFGLCIFAPSVFAADATSWSERLTLNGDLRFRHEYTSKSRASDDGESHRERMRLRLGLATQVHPNVKVKARLGTGDSGSPIGGNATFTNNADKKPLYVDAAMMDITLSEQLHLWLGKMDNPLRPLGQSQLIYDADYNPEGVALTMKASSLFLNAGAFMIQERGNTNAAPNYNGTDAHLMAVQAGIKGDGDLGYTLGVGYNGFSGIKGHAAINPGAWGNTLVGTDYENDYQVGEIFAELRLKSAGLFSLFGDYANNFDPSENNVAYLAGVQYQTLDDAGKPQWTFQYNYRSVEKDATLSAVNDSDFGNGTDGNFGHTVLVGWNFADNMGLTAYYARAYLDNAGNPFWTDKGMFDFSASF